MTAMKEDQQRQQKARYAKKHLEGDLENFHNVPFWDASSRFGRTKRLCDKPLFSITGM